MDAGDGFEAVFDDDAQLSAVIVDEAGGQVAAGGLLHVFDAVRELAPDEQRMRFGGVDAQAVRAGHIDQQLVFQRLAVDEDAVAIEDDEIRCHARLALTA